MTPPAHSPAQARRTEQALVLALCALVTALVVGWSATGHSTAPDDGLHQIDVLMLDERVPGVEAVDGRPTMVVATGRCPAGPPPPRMLSLEYGLVLSDDPELARRLALHAAAERCQPGYVLLSGDGRVRYRSYDPGWAGHSFEQEVLLDAIAAEDRG